MRIHADFCGGNILVGDIIDNVVSVEPDLRDTTIPWFYWCFCVQGAQGRTLSFRFPPNCVGWFGVAVSDDLESWRWSGGVDEDENGFSYAFGPDEDCVYFCHDMRYSVKRFENFAQSHPQLQRLSFCQSRKGREVPAFAAGEGEEWLILTSRHHCCESTGTYVMEGAVEEYLHNPPPGVRLLCVPFVDMDGVVDGDPGKCRAPHDHNRDYLQELYPEIRALKAFAQSHRIRWFVDLHSPWHKGGRNDTVFLVTPSDWMKPRVKLLGECMQKAIAACPDAMAYDPVNNMPWNVDWNVSAPAGQMTSTAFFGSLPGIRYASTLETTYFGTAQNPVTMQKLLDTGKCLIRALRMMNEKEGIA